MGIVFIVTGVGLLAGGAYAVVEGWPYLLIERGFTLVIVGVVLMTAGVLMLALSRVMMELGRVRGQISSAVMALSVASMGQGVAGREQESRVAPDDDGGGRQSGSMAIGAAVLAGGALAGGALARERDAPVEPDDHRAGPGIHEACGDEPDLFALSPGASVEDPAERAGSAASVAPGMEATAHQAIADEPEPWAQPSWREAGTGADVEHDEHPDAALDAFVAATRHELESGSPPRVQTDLDRLRDRLALATESAGRDFDETPSLVAERREPSDAYSDIADWGTTVSPARERWFPESGPVESGPVETGPVEAEPDRTPTYEPEPEPEPDTLPVWPPQAREAASFDADTASSEANHGRPAVSELAGREPVQPEAEPEALPVFAPPSEPARADPDEPSVEAPDEPPPPAASEEGVVGAYQVGATYFTLYADGSIQARTPEGDYSFASMDELKTYLASERSRIGA